MRSVNKVILIGHLTRDPELRQTSTGQSVATFSIATNRYWTTSTGEKQEAADFHDLVAWGKLAEICDQYLTKGTAIYTEGRLSTRSWDAQDGSKRYKTEVIMNELNILKSKDAGDRANATKMSTNIPAPTAPASTTTANKTDSPVIAKEPVTTGATESAPLSTDINVEDIPF